MPVCAKCGKADAELRVHVADGPIGAMDVVVCEPCHEKERAAVRAESRATGFKLRVPPSWRSLTRRGFYTELPATVSTESKGG